MIRFPGRRTFEENPGMNPFPSLSAPLNLLLVVLLLSPAVQAQSAPIDEAQLRKRTEDMLRQYRGQRAVPIRATASLEQALHQYLVAEIAGQRGNEAGAIESLTLLAKRSGDPRIARRALELAFQTRQQDRAMEAASLWISMEPESTLARQAMAVLLVNQGSLDTAKSSMKQLLQDAARAPALYMQLNQLLARFPDRPAVVEAMKELSAVQPELPHSSFSLAVALASNQESVGALVAARRALEKDPAFQPAAILVGQLLRESSAAAARTHFESFLRSQSDAVEVRLAYARLLAGERAYPEAAEQYRRLAEFRPTDPEMPYALGLVAQQSGDLSGADAAFRRALEMNVRDRNPLWMSLGQVEESRSNWNAALAWYERIEGDEYFIASRLKMAGIIAKQKDLPAARAFLREFAAAGGDQAVQFVLAEAQLLRDSRDYMSAKSVLSEGLARIPDSPELLYDRAMVLEKLNDFDGLERDLRKVISVKPDHAHAYNALGYTLADRNIRLSEALKLIEKAVALSPRDGFILDSLGWVHFRLGNLERAISILRQAYSLRSDPEIAAHLGEALWTAGQKEEAGRLIEANRAKHPGSESLDALARRMAQ